MLGIKTIISLSIGGGVIIGTALGLIAPTVHEKAKELGQKRDLKKQTKAQADKKKMWAEAETVTKELEKARGTSIEIEEVEIVEVPQTIMLGQMEGA